MEEWHQKLHNNTSPDDVVICEALIAYIEADLDIARYWSTLQVTLPFAIQSFNFNCNVMTVASRISKNDTTKV